LLLLFGDEMHILQLNEALSDVKRFLELFIENILVAITLGLLLTQKLKQQNKNK